MDSKRDLTEVTRKTEMNEMKLFSPDSVDVNHERIRIVNPLTIMRSNCKDETVDISLHKSGGMLMLYFDQAKIIILINDSVFPHFITYPLCRMKNKMSLVNQLPQPCYSFYTYSSLPLFISSIYIMTIKIP